MTVPSHRPKPGAPHSCDRPPPKNSSSSSCPIDPPSAPKLLHLLNLWLFWRGTTQVLTPRTFPPSSSCNNRKRFKTFRLFKRWKKTPGGERGLVPFGVFETKSQNVLVISPEWGAVWSSWSPLSAGWKLVRGSQRNTKNGETDFSLFFFLVQSLLKLLQLRTAHQSIVCCFFLCVCVQKYFSPLL